MLTRRPRGLLGAVEAAEAVGLDVVVVEVLVEDLLSVFGLSVTVPGELEKFRVRLRLLCFLAHVESSLG